MPYIDVQQKENLKTRGPKNAGELNYAITKLLIEYLADNGLRYQQINDIMGAVHSAASEFYIRVARPYEDEKIIDNGDVYPKWILGGEFKNG